jgi:hypothetical protein
LQKTQDVVDAQVRRARHAEGPFLGAKGGFPNSMHFFEK